jgi:hypothetical protein
VVIRNPDKYSAPYWLSTSLIDYFGRNIHFKMENEKKCSDLFSEEVKGVTYAGVASPASSVASIGAPAPAPADPTEMLLMSVYQYTPYDAQTVVSTRRLRDCCISESGQDGKALTIPTEVNRPSKPGCTGCFRGGNRFCSFRIWNFDTLEIKARGVCRYCEQINCRTKCADGKVRKRLMLSDCFCV